MSGQFMCLYAILKTWFKRSKDKYAYATICEEQVGIHKETNEPQNFPEPSTASTKEMEVIWSSDKTYKLIRQAQWR